MMIIQWVCATDTVATGCSSSTFTAVVVMLMMAVIKIVTIGVFNTTACSLTATIVKENDMDY